MTIGSKKKSTRSSMRIVKFLDAPGGFYGRMFEPDEPEGPGDAPAWVGEELEQGDGGPQTCGPAAAAAAGAACPGPVDPEGEGFDANDGVTEGDDGETLLRVKVSRGGPGSRWSRRSSRRKPREAPPPEPELTAGPPPSLGVGVTEGHEPMGALIHFTVTGDADDQVLIRDKKRGREEEEEGEEERRLRREQEEGMKTLKRNTVKNYRKALDRAFRRGWEAFITNLYSITLNPVTSSPTTTPSKKHQRSIILAEFQ
ncbi:unnamed protein product [Gadus morhua 'NCC']